MSTGTETAELDDLHSNDVITLAVTGDAKLLISGGLDRSVVLWDLPLGTLAAQIPDFPDDVNGVAVSPDARTLAVAVTGFDTNLTLWDLRTRAQLRDFGHHQGAISVAFTPDGRFVAAGCAAGDDDVIKLWEVATGAEAAILASHMDEISAIAFSPDGSLLASCSADKTVRILKIGVRLTAMHS